MDSTKCPVKSKSRPPVCNLGKASCWFLSFNLGFGVTGFAWLRSIGKRTLYDNYFTYSLPDVMAKLSRVDGTLHDSY